MAKPFDITQFPLEIFEMIAAFLDSSSYVEDHLEDDPEEVFTRKGEQIAPDARLPHLKNASLVCSRWYEAFHPIVFRHLFVRLSLPELSSSTSHLTESCVMVVDFIEHNISTLGECVQSVTLFLNDSIEEGNRDRYDGFEVLDNGRITLVTRDAVRCNYSNDLEKGARALLYDPFTEFWAALKLLMPERVTLVGLDSHLTFYLLGVSNYTPLVNHCGLLARLRLFSVARNSTRVEPDKDFESGPYPPYPAKNILSIRCWTDVLLNEGSELRDWPDEDRDTDAATRKRHYGVDDLSLRATLERCIEQEHEYCLNSLDGSFFASLTYVCHFGCYAEIAEESNICIWNRWDSLFDADVLRIRTLPHNLKLDEVLESPLAFRAGDFEVDRFHYDRFRDTGFALDLWNRLVDTLEGNARIEFLDFEDRAWEKIASQTTNAHWTRPCADRPGYIVVTKASPLQQ